MKRYSITGIPARPETRRGRKVEPATPALVRLHTLPAGVPLETRDPGLLRAIATDLERAAQWLEAERFVEPSLLRAAAARLGYPLAVADLVAGLRPDERDELAATDPDVAAVLAAARRRPSTSVVAS